MCAPYETVSISTETLVDLMESLRRKFPHTVFHLRYLRFGMEKDVERELAPDVIEQTISRPMNKNDFACATGCWNFLDHVCDCGWRGKLKRLQRQNPFVQGIVRRTPFRRTISRLLLGD